MIQLGSCAGLPQQPGLGSRVAETAGWQNLDGYVAIELLVMGPIDYAHPACANLSDDAEMC
jgi:hypothetical protein